MKLILILMALMAGSAYASKTILVTAFDGFAGESVNWSYSVAKKIKSIESKIGSDVKIEICQVQTIYDQGAAQAQKCFEALKEKPVAVLSMGEGGCQVDLETVAHNRDRTPNLKDNAGNLRAGSIIKPGRPMHVPLGFPIDKIFCETNLTSAERNFAKPSTSPGAFVCNNLAFHMAEYLKEKNVPYQFIHVPSHKCVNSKKTPLSEQQALSKSASLISKLLKTELVEIEKFSGYSSPLPVSLAPLRVEIERLKGSKHKFDQCRRNFLNGLYDELIVGEKP